MSPEGRARLEEWLPPSLKVDEEGFIVGSRGDGLLDERTPGFVRIPNLHRRARRDAVLKSQEALPVEPIVYAYEGYISVVRDDWALPLAITLAVPGWLRHCEKPTYFDDVRSMLWDRERLLPEFTD